MSNEPVSASSLGLALGLYRQLEGALKVIRDLNNGEESEEEDDILDEMEKVWYELTDEEQKLLKSERSEA